MRRFVIVALIVFAGALTGAGEACAGAALDRARDLFEERALPACIEAAAEAVTREPRNPDAHVLAGLVFEIIGDLEAAETAYQRALQIDPQTGAAKDGLFRINGDGSAEQAGFEIVDTRTGFAVRLASRPGLLMPIETDSVDDPELLGFEPLSEDGRLGILRWYSGSPGTAYLTPLVRARVIDLAADTWSQSIIDMELDKKAEWTFRDPRTAVVTEPSGDVTVLSLPSRSGVNATTIGGN